MSRVTMPTDIPMSQDPNEESEMRIFVPEDLNGSEDEPLDLEGDAFAEVNETAYATFEEALASIEGESVELTALAGFSDMSRKQVRALGSIWKQLAPESRATIAEHAFAMAEEDLLLDFMRFFRFLLDDESGAVRQTAARGLAPYDDEDLIAPLIERATSDPIDDVRAGALEALSSFAAMGEFGMLDDKTMRRIRDVLFGTVMDGKAPGKLRATALTGAAIHSSDEEVQHAIAAFFTAGDSELRYGALQAMGRSVGSHWLPILEATLRSADPDERQAAAKSLGAYEDVAVVPLLTMVAREDLDPKVRAEAIQALGTIGGRNAFRELQTLREYVSDDEIDIVDAAIAEAEQVIALEEGEPQDDMDLDDPEMRPLGI